MLRGDLSDVRPDRLLRELAQQQATGCLVLDAPPSRGGEDAQVHLRAGKVYAAAMAGGTFLVGTRLSTSYGLGPEALDEALEAQRAELHGWRLGEILVHLGYVDALAVDSISLEQVLEIVTEACSWHTGAWRFRTGDRTRAMLTHPVTVPDLLDRARERRLEWSRLAATLGDEDVPLLPTGTSLTDPPVELVTLLKVAAAHGDRGLQVCSHAAGLSLLEGARLAVVALAGGALTQRPALDLAVGGVVEPAGARRAPAPSSPPTPPAPSAPVAQPPAAPTAATAGHVSHALAALLRLPGSAGHRAAEALLPATIPVRTAAAEDPAVTYPPPEHAEPEEQVATVLDLTAARAARSTEHAVTENAAHLAALGPTRAAAAEPAVSQAAAQVAAGQAVVEAGADQAAAERAAVEQAAIERATAEQAAADHRAAAARAAAERAAAQAAADQQAADRQAAADRSAAEQVAAELAAAELARQQLAATQAAQAEDAEALELAAALRAAADAHAAQLRRAEPAASAEPVAAAEPVAPAAAYDPLPVSDSPVSESPTYGTPVSEPGFEPVEARAATWGQGFLATSPPGMPSGMFGTRDPQADTASLMRELTSLGLSEEQEAASFRSAAPAPASAPVAPAPPPEKKRKSFFGR